jgi:fucose permease
VSDWDIVTTEALPARSTWNVKVTIGLLLSHFALFGVISGVKGVVWADLLNHLRLGEGPFGSAQLVPWLVSMGIVICYAWLSRRFGAHRLVVVGLALLMLALIGLAAVGSLAGLLGVFVLLGFGTGLSDGAMNQGSLDWEQSSGEKGLNLLHAGFSGGAVLGAIAAGVGLGSGLSYRHILMLMAGVTGVVCLVTTRLPYPPALHRPVATTSAGDWREIVGHPVVRLLLLICLLSVVIESVVFVWGVIYLRDVVKASAFAGAGGFALFNAAMFVGRMGNARLVASHGARVSLMCSGVGLMIASILLVLASNVLLAVVGLALLGLGVAGIFPTVVGAAGGELPGKSGTFTGVVMSAAYLGFTITPPLIGWIAQATSLRGAMGIAGICGVLIVVLASMLGDATGNRGRGTR